MILSHRRIYTFLCIYNIQRRFYVLVDSSIAALAVGLNTIGVHGEGVSVVKCLRSGEAVNTSLIAVAHIISASDHAQVARLVDQDVRLVGFVAAAGGGGELEEVVADDDVFITARLGVCNDTVAAEVADVRAVKRNSTRRAAEESGGLAEYTGDSALGARRG